MADKSVIANIETRVGRLIEDHRRLRGLCAELSRQCETLREEKRALEEQLRRLDAEVARMQLTEGLAGGSANRDKARARVNRLMREVDKCIALLERAELSPDPEEGAAKRRGQDQAEKPAKRPARIPGETPETRAEADPDGMSGDETGHGPETGAAAPQRENEA